MRFSQIVSSIGIQSLREQNPNPLKTKTTIAQSRFQSTLRRLPNLLTVRCVLLLLLILLWHALGAQQLTQTIKGEVVERDTRYPLRGATVRLLTDTSRVTGATTNTDGEFRIENVPLGRHRLWVTFVGYEEAFVDFGSNNCWKDNFAGRRAIQTASRMASVLRRDIQCNIA